MTKDATIQLFDRLNQYIEEVNDLFKNENLTESFQQNIQRLNNYFIRLFNKDINYSKRQALVNEYDLLLNTMRQIKAGSLTADQALQNLNSLARDRKIDVIVHNIFKTCELLFWLTAAMTSYAFCIGFGIPLMFFNLPVGLAITLGTSVLMLQAANQILESANEFKSFNAIDTQERLERNVVSFFLPPKKDEEELEANLRSELSPCY
ncbi:DUF5638 domain-containing protein [Legionella sp. km772]|uniref:DUF5638 domain-containing protein n=1 Tax=Legionella sp. km772 TaxID=2498111 RepID=UPI000F8C4413|nr:DUF5638 domain-containing protein [Legionella sp. km772]RUR13749.1 hypothetical protein ELY15_01600 [Legionella sp. km772]